MIGSSLNKAETARHWARDVINIPVSLACCISLLMGTWSVNSGVYFKRGEKVFRQVCAGFGGGSALRGNLH